MNTLPSLRPFLKLKNFNEQNKERKLYIRTYIYIYILLVRTDGWTLVYCVMDNAVNYYIVFCFMPFKKSFVFCLKGIFFISFVLSIVFASVIVSFRLLMPVIPTWKHRLVGKWAVCNSDCDIKCLLHIAVTMDEVWLRVLAKELKIQSYVRDWNVCRNGENVHMGDLHTEIVDTLNASLQ
jgi:hypothetical protein